MPVLHAIILGIVQGLTEVFPISSSAHLVIIPWIFKWPYQGLSFDVALHVGTAVAFCIYFFKDWVQIIKGAFAKEGQGRNNLFLCIVIGTIPAVLAGLILEKKAEFAFRSPLILAGMLFLFAIILWWADNSLGTKQKSLEEVNLKTAIFIGLAQMLAIIPGVSRSGITITAGLLKGFSREAAARFSFLLATPIVFAAGLLKLSKLHPGDLTVSFWAGVLFSAISGFFAIGFLLNLVKRTSLKVFVFYRIALAAFILVAFFSKLR
ncbi:MAG: undecaprenyl-diphosphate phosphatase [Candidatus Omnitrophica bacterium]|nr:undecaprenyl-diphosphate phosphatase [Candidatus Omnitrophota bacterium]